MKILGRILFVIGIVAVIPAALNLVGDLSTAGKHQREIEDLDSTRAALRKKLGALNLEFRGYQQSLPTIPDSIKMANSGKISEKLREYSKRIGGMEMQEEDLTRRMKRQERLRSDALADTPRVSGGLGGVALVLIVAGLLVSRRARG